MLPTNRLTDLITDPDRAPYVRPDPREAERQILELARAVLAQFTKPGGVARALELAQAAVRKWG